MVDMCDGNDEDEGLGMMDENMENTHYWFMILSIILSII